MYGIISGGGGLVLWGLLKGIVEIETSSFAGFRFPKT